MPTPIAPRIILAQNARVELHTLARAHTTPQSLALRARMVLRAAAVDQPTNVQIGRELGCSNLTVGKWRRRYLELGLPGLQDAPRGAPAYYCSCHARLGHLGGQRFATRPQAHRHEVDAG
jgi:hypothetical protein